MASSFTERMVGAATLSVPIYEELEHDRGATGQAAAVVAIAAAAAAIGAYHWGPIGVAGAIVAQFVGWFVWAAITLFIGTRLFGGTADMGEMLRTLGFAQAPGVLAVVGIVPILGWAALPVIAIWTLVAGVVAVRQALDFDTGKAVGTVFFGWLLKVLIGLVLALFTFGFGAFTNLF